MDRHNRRISFSPAKRRPAAQPKTVVEDSTSFTSRMKVVVRVRPQTDDELSQSKSLVKTINSQKLIFDPKEDVQPFFFQGKKQGRRDMLRKQNRALDFVFDRVFDASSTNDDVFEDTTKGILSSLLEGFNCSVFVYGATGAGKTFTMLGCEGMPGITYLTMVELYRQIAAEATERTFEVWVSYMEVYNENVRDLLKPKSSTVLALRDDGNSGVKVAGLELKVIQNADELLALLAQGNKNRTQHPTDANAESSRSHAIFQVYICMTNRLSKEKKLVKLSMIDLAGSERASASGCKGMRFKEGANINKSLLALGNCINGLADGLKHIPYRDSKLTRILKDSLGGNCHTIMIANISPNVNSFEDTYNTLKYATRAKKIKSKIKRNILSVALPAAQYQAMIENLQVDLAAALAKLKKYEEGATNSAPARTVATNEEHTKMVQKLQAIYEEKTKLHAKIIRHESNLQILKYNRYLRIGDAEALGELNLKCSDLLNDLKKIYLALEANKVKMSSVEKDVENTWVLERRNNEALDKVMKEAQEAGLQDVDDKDIKIIELGLKKEEVDAEILHLHNLLSIQYDRLKYQEDFNKKVLKAATSYYTVLDGMNKVTEQMKEDYMKLRHMTVMSKKVRWGQAHEKEHESPTACGGSLPLRIPPKIEEFSVLPFATYNPPAPGNPNNISQLNGSKNSITPSPSASRFMSHYETLEDFVRDTVGENRLGVHLPALGTDKACARFVDFEQAFSPVLPVAAGLNSTIDISPPACDASPPKRAGLNVTFDSDSVEDISMMNNAFVGGEGKETLLNVDKLNGTFVLHNLEAKNRVPDRIEIKKNTLKRPLPTLALVPCNKENKFKAPNAAFLRALRLPGPKVPKVPKVISPRNEKTPKPIRTPLRTMNSRTTLSHSVAKPSKPFAVAKDVPKATPTSRPTLTSRHPQFKPHVKMQ